MRKIITKEEELSDGGAAFFSNLGSIDCPVELESYVMNRNFQFTSPINRTSIHLGRK